MLHHLAFFALLAVGYPLAPSRLRAEDVPQIARWVYEAAEAEEASIDDAELEMVWIAFESSGRPDARSIDGHDCSLLQLRGAARAGYSCAELADDPVLAARLWLRHLHAARLTCGSTARALGAVATGVCGGAPRLVARRCALAGVDCTE